MDGERRAAPIIEVLGVSRRFGDIHALRELSFSVGARQIVGLLGPNGAGKTTLLEILLGLQKVSEGEVALFGAPLRGRAYPKRRVGAVFQAESYLEGMRVLDYAQLYATSYGVDGGEAQILAQARLEGRARAPVASLSGGEAQRLFLAASLVHAPELVLLDEPTAHLDPASRAELSASLRRLSERATVLIATHDLHEAASLCDRVLFLAEGRLRADGTPAALVESVPLAARQTGDLADAFFHHCAVRIDPGGVGR